MVSIKPFQLADLMCNEELSGYESEELGDRRCREKRPFKNQFMKDQYIKHKVPPENDENKTRYVETAKDYSIDSKVKQDIKPKNVHNMQTYVSGHGIKVESVKPGVKRDLFYDRNTDVKL